MKHRILAAAAAVLLLTGCTIYEDELPPSLQDYPENNLEAFPEELPEETAEAVTTSFSERFSDTDGNDNSFSFPKIGSDFEPFEYDRETIPPAEETTVQTESTETTGTAASLTETTSAATEPAEEPTGIVVHAADLIYETKSGQAALFGMEPRPEADGAPLLLPETINGIPVTAVSAYGFLDEPFADRLRLPETVTQLGDNAFRSSGVRSMRLLTASELKAGNFVFMDCEELETVAFTDITAEFGDYCFAGSAAETVHCENSALTFQDHCFESMPSLTQAVFEGDASFSKGCFKNCRKLETVQLSGGSILLGDSFCADSTVKTVSVSNCTGKAADLAFSDCSALEKLEIGEGITAFGYGVCSRCSNLREVTLPASLTAIGEDSFTRCPNLTITAPEGSFALRYAAANGIPSRVKN